MSVWDRLKGKPSPPRETTTTPPPQGRWEPVQDAGRAAGQGLKDTLDALRGKPRAPQLVCREGHVIRQGNDICDYGHYVG
ncbi:hypothetical protein [Arthrobacter sp. UYCo732]|uniref:hypothetical protein n=1 Tax=Arthrobacter sp. UYCo732 TaxID=3156336 RepID=UPI00339611FD